MSDLQLQCRVSTELGELVRADAAARGLSIAQWLRQLVIEHFEQQDKIRNQLLDLDRRVSTIEQVVLNGKK